MDVLNVMVDDEEMGQFEEETGEEWPEGGMECPVTGCPSGKHWFTTLGSYWSHFHKYHRRRVSVFSCPKCGLKDIKMSGIRRHMRRAHGVTRGEGVKRVTEVNTKFVDQGDFRRPRPRIHRAERDQVQEERRRNLPPAPLFPLTEDHNPSDEKCPVGGFRK
jgi:hypothetical protein